MSVQKESSKTNTSRVSVTLLGRVEKIIPAAGPCFPERAQIVVVEADHLYREIRVENSLAGRNGKLFRLKVGARVDVRIEADTKWTRTSDLN